MLKGKKRTVDRMDVSDYGEGVGGGGEESREQKERRLAWMGQNLERVGVGGGKRRSRVKCKQ